MGLFFVVKIPYFRSISKTIHPADEPKMKKNPANIILSFRKRISKALIALFSFFTLSCDFQNPMAFELPTWFFDLTFPLVQQKYSLEGMIDNKQIFPTPDNLGMQLMFEGILPETSIGTDILEVEIDQNIEYEQVPVTAPSFSFSIDRTINLTIPIAPEGNLINDSGTSFSVPPSEPQAVTKEVWNAIASAVDINQEIDIDIPEIPADQLVLFIESIDGFVIQNDAGSSISDFNTTISNDGLPTNITNPTISLITDLTSPPKTLANHTQASVAKDASFGPEITSLSQDSLGGAIRINVGFGIESTSANSVTINAGDNVQVNVSIRLRIAGLEAAIIKVKKSDLPITLPKITFPSDIEIYSGKLKAIGFNVNEIVLSNIISTYPLDVDFSMNFKNFIPPPSEDSIKIETVLKKGMALDTTFYMNGYDFVNPAGQDIALTELTLDLAATLPAQSAKIPLDGTDMGALSLKVILEKLHFESIEANIIQEFPATTFTIEGMPLGFSGMEFPDVKLEIEMLNGIRLPVILDFDMIGVNQKNETLKVNALSTLASPENSGETSKTITRLSRDGTTTLKYKSPSSELYHDSTTVAPKSGETTIVELMSSNPAVFNVLSRARIDGRGTLEAGMHIGGKYRLLAPFEVIMAPMTFLSVTNTAVKEMNHGDRNRIRSTLQSASLELTVENKIPSGGELAMLMSNTGYFPLDTTAAALSDFKDTMVVKKIWEDVASTRVYLVSNCESLNPITGKYYIFDVMDDFSDCVDGMPYVVKSIGTGMDTVVSYVDTLLTIPLPDPVSYYPATNSGVRAGQVKEPGFAEYSSPVSTHTIRLMTNPGQPYMAPRFHLNGSDGKKVFISSSDYIDINSNITFKLSSTGMTSAAPDEIVINYPNGHQTLHKDNEVAIQWQTFGTIDKVDLAYYAGTDPDVNEDTGWTEIAKDITNEKGHNAYNWKPSSTTGINNMAVALRDSVRIRVVSTDGKTRDMSGWYFTISHSSGKIQSVSEIVKIRRNPYKQ